jgi:hypothetical protein
MARMFNPPHPSLTLEDVILSVLPNNVTFESRLFGKMHYEN